MLSGKDSLFYLLWWFSFKHRRAVHSTMSRHSHYEEQLCHIQHITHKRAMACADPKKRIFVTSGSTAVRERYSLPCFCALRSPVIL